VSDGLLRRISIVRKRPSQLLEACPALHVHKNMGVDPGPLFCF
jgi:hypothetical protein